MKIFLFLTHVKWKVRLNSISLFTWKSWSMDHFFFFFLGRIENLAYPYINQNPTIRSLRVTKGLDPWISTSIDSDGSRNFWTRTHWHTRWVTFIFYNMMLEKKYLHIIFFPCLCLAYVLCFFSWFLGSLASFLFGGLGWILHRQKKKKYIWEGIHGVLNSIFEFDLHPFFFIKWIKWLFKFLCHLSWFFKIHICLCYLDFQNKKFKEKLIFDLWIQI